MDELNVVKKGSRAWLWIVGLIILAAIIWAVVAASHRNATTPASERLPAPGHQAPAVAEHLAKL